MGTRSSIAIKTEDGIKAIYCHWDGYIDNNGRILKEHYQSPAKTVSYTHLTLPTIYSV